MKRVSMTTMAMGSARHAFVRAIGLAVLAGVAASVAQAQAASASKQIMQDSWRLSATAGAYVPRSAVILAADGRNTQLGAAPSVSLELQYLANHRISIYASGVGAFSTLATGTAIQPTATGPSNNVTLIGTTGGLVLGLFGDRFQPTVRIGGGLKGYMFDLKGATNQWRPTGDFGVGFRGAGSGPIDISAEVRYLPSTFDQGKLPLRGIVPQAQSQTDLMFTIGVSIRP